MRAILKGTTLSKSLLILHLYILYILLHFYVFYFCGISRGACHTDFLFTTNIYILNVMFFMPFYIYAIL